MSCRSWPIAQSTSVFYKQGWMLTYVLFTPIVFASSEEYNQIMKKAAENVVSGPPVHVSDALEVTVVMDENDFPAAFSTPNNFIDVEVLDKSPFLSRF